MKLKIAFLLIAQVAIGKTSLAQNSAKPILKELQIGDQVPHDMVMGKLVNYQKETVKFSDFKGKLLIIDFWSTTCGDCVGSLPKMDSLQKRFGDRIAIIPSTTEDAEMISKYLKKKPWNLPSIVEDSSFLIKDPKTGKDKVTGKALWGLFPHSGNPYEVWIDENGKVLATTRHQEVNASNIENYLKTGKLNVKTSTGDIGRMFNFDKDLLVDGNGGMEDNYIMRSILTGELDLGGERNNGSNCITKFYNTTGTSMFKSIIGLNLASWFYYRNVFLLGRPYSKFITNIFLENNKGKTIFLGDAESAKEAYKQLERFTGEKVYCYNLTVPAPGVIDAVFYREYMLNDLNRYFNYTVKIEKRKIPCFLIFNPKKTKHFLASKTDTSSLKYIYSNEIDKEYFEEVKNLPMKDFIRYMNSFYYVSPPIFNETGCSDERINLKLHLKHGHNFPGDAVKHRVNLDEWRAALQRNGLDIKVEDREVEVMVFRKKDTPSK